MTTPTKKLLLLPAALLAPAILMGLYVQVRSWIMPLYLPTPTWLEFLDFTVLALVLYVGIYALWKTTYARKQKIIMTVVFIPFIAATSFFAAIWVACFNGNCL